MKKLAVGLGLLFSSIVIPVFASNGVNSNRCVSVSNDCGGFILGISGIYWQLLDPHLDFALTFPNDPSNPLAIQNANHHNLNIYYDWGFRADIGYRFACSGSDLILTYTDYHHNGDADVIRGLDRLVSAISGNWPASAVLSLPIIADDATLLIPAAGQLVDPDIASARGNIDLKVVDLDFGQSFNVGCNTKLRWFGGLRYSHIEHKLEADYRANAISTDLTTTGTSSVTFNSAVDFNEIIHQSSDFEGIGPRIGFEGNYNLGCGFGVLGSLATSLIVGEINSSLDDIFTTNVNLVVTAVDTAGLSVELGDLITASQERRRNNTDPDVTRVAPNLDAKLAINYTYQFSNCSRTRLAIEAGWEVNHYWLVLDRLSDQGAINTSTNGHSITNIGFDGPYVGVQLYL